MAKATKKKRARGEAKLAKPITTILGKAAKKADSKRTKTTAQLAPKRVAKTLRALGVVEPPPHGATAEVLDRIWGVVLSRRDADPNVSHSARLLSRGPAKCAQKFGEEAVECLIEAVAGNRPALVAESADVLYHMLVMWVANDVRPEQVWAELQHREGMSGIAEKAGRAATLLLGARTTKIP
ncbi:MAG: phosphoribosyl-ATP diphosphatase [Rhodospirillales bacterium]|nr:phosphoribosyl-ATP diphosphatase [Rhodospirillales bacterium]